MRVQSTDCSDDGVTALVEIADANESVVTVKCLEVLAESHEPSVRIVLAQGLAKGEKWILLSRRL